ncbi:MAG: cytochrome c biogenesis protein ResB [Bdellovibrionales bacterium]|nr:cytochrome c biogenesis protein ResB [Bdellovibrionales bacterium]
MNSRIEGILEKIWSILISLKLAVLVIASLAVTLAIATILESKHDTRTAQYFVYRAGWFYVLLSLLGLNILAVALSRLPWKKKHTPFLLAHAGILMILSGSWLTYVNGVDGVIRIGEGEVNSTVELDQFVLMMRDGETSKTADFPWVPDSVARNFKPREFPDLKIRVEKYISDAEPRIRFLPSNDPARSAPAVKIKIIGAPMGGAPEFWLWSGAAPWASQKLGPARFLIRKETQKDLEAPVENGPEARLDFVVSDAGGLRFESTSVRGEKMRGAVDLARLEQKDEPLIIDPGWRMPIKIELKAFLASAVNQTDYIPRKVKPVGMGTAQPEPALQISLLQNPDSKLWLGLGDRADFRDALGMPISIGYFPKRVILPYGIRLKRFEMTHNPGTMEPASYSSFVQVVQDLKKSEVELNSIPVHHITMNEPLPMEGYTFYQASYIPDQPRPTVTILSVNHDPGRFLKYSGSILLILGAILLYLAKVIQKKKKETVRV